MQANGQRKLPPHSESVRARYGFRLRLQVPYVQWLAADAQGWASPRPASGLWPGWPILFRIGIAARLSVSFRNQAAAEHPHATTGLLASELTAIRRTDHLFVSNRFRSLPLQRPDRRDHHGQGPAKRKRHARRSNALSPEATHSRLLQVRGERGRQLRIQKRKATLLQFLRQDALAR